MVARVLAAAACLVVLLAAGCGSDGPSTRELVTDYIDRANAIQVKLAAPAASVAEAGRELGSAGADRSAVEAKLREAARTMEVLRGRLEILEAPDEAQRLRSLLLAVMQQEIGLAHELADLVAFVPAFESALRPLGPAGRTLNDVLNASGTVAAKADALDAYGAAVGRVLARLRALSAPPVSRPGLEAQATALEEVRAGTAALARALREQRADEIPGLLEKIQRAATSTQSLAAQRARIAAVRAYNARVREVDELVTKAQRERNRLQTTLG